MMSVSAPGVLLVESEGAPLESGATLLPDAAAAVAALAAATERLYLLARVDGDVGEAAVRGALEAGGVVASSSEATAGASPSSASVPAHRLLFVSTDDGKTAAVRALEVGLHIDAEEGTLAALARFVPRLARVGAPGGGGSGGGWVGAPSLSALLGL